MFSFVFLYAQTDCFLEVKLWPSDLTKTEFIEAGLVQFCVAFNNIME